MDKTLQTTAWNCLPREFKEEVKKIYQEAENGWIVEDTLENIFGIHNLISDAEGEEMLTVPRKKVQEKWQRAYEQEEKYSRAQDSPIAREELYYNRGIMSVIDTLFGSKCLPDEVGNEVNFASKEPKPAELNLNKESSTCTNDCPSQCKSQDFDNIVKDGFSKERRLNIATRFAVSLTTVSYREINRYGKEAKEYATDVAKAAFTLADALIKEAEKGGEDVAG